MPGHVTLTVTFPWSFRARTLLSLAIIRFATVWLRVACWIGPVAINVDLSVCERRS